MTWLVTAAGVILTDVGIGLLIGVLFSLLSIVFRTQRLIELPYRCSCDLTLLFTSPMLYTFMLLLHFAFVKVDTVTKMIFVD